jgi:AcrR family transcriptional regulator
MQVDDATELPPKDRVLGAAMDIIVERGLDQLRLAEIARRTKMSTGHVLYYFGTKDRILVETLRWCEGGVRERRQAAISAAVPGWPQLRVFIDYYLPGSTDDPTWALWVEMWARRHSDKDVVVINEMAAGWQSDLRSILRRGRRAGAFVGGHGSFPVRLTALMNGFAVYVLENTRSVDEVTDLTLEQCRIELRPR